MLKVCINYETGGGRRGGHFTHYLFTGLPGVEVAALADSNPEAENNFRLTGAKRRYESFTAMMEVALETAAALDPGTADPGKGGGA